MPRDPLGLRIALVLIAATAMAGPLPRLKVSENHRFLVTESGKPFFYLADTAWELFHRLDRQQAIEYLDTRAAQGFTAIQAVALAELSGITDPNAYGKLPLVDADPLKPAVTPGNDPANPDQYDYWAHVEFNYCSLSTYWFLLLRSAFLILKKSRQ